MGQYVFPLHRYVVTCPAEFVFYFPISHILGCYTRLDRPTSGIVLFALSSEAANKFQKVFTDKDLTTKEYLVIARGTCPPGTWIQDLPLTNATKKNRNRKKKRRAAAKAAAKAAEQAENGNTATESTDGKQDEDEDDDALDVGPRASNELGAVVEQNNATDSRIPDTKNASTQAAAPPANVRPQDLPQQAITEFTTLATFFRLSLLKAKLITGSRARIATFLAFRLQIDLICIYYIRTPSPDTKTPR
jgi:23S rRNA-/tRNA-specific pseudouridylate synthase